MEMERMNVDGMIDALASIVPTDDDTYTGEDGRLYCSRCNTPRQSRIEFLGNVKIVPCLCKCMMEELEFKENREKREKRKARILASVPTAFFDPDFKKYTFAQDDGSNQPITDAMVSYVEQFDKFWKTGKGLLLYGNVGTGKTFIAACAGNALDDLGYACMMTNFSRLTNKLMEMRDGKQKCIDALGKFDLIIIDDLGVERDTEYMNENVTTILDSLYRAKVPMIITSNYTPKQLTEDCEIRKRRVYDRLLERCHPIKVDGPSRRKQMGRSDFAEMNKLLGL